MAARCLLLVWVKSAKSIPQPRANVFQERGRCWGILPSGGAVLGIVPGHGGHRHRQDLRQPVLDGGDDLEEMKSGLSSQKGITMLRILNDTTKKHQTKICLVLFGAPAGIRIPDTLIKRIQGASFVKFQKFEGTLFYRIIAKYAFAHTALFAYSVMLCNRYPAIQVCKKCAKMCRRAKQSPMDKSITGFMAGFRTTEQTPFDIEMRFPMNKRLSCRC